MPIVFVPDDLAARCDDPASLPSDAAWSAASDSVVKHTSGPVTSTPSSTRVTSTTQWLSTSNDSGAAPAIPAVANPAEMVAIAAAIQLGLMFLMANS